MLSATLPYFGCGRVRRYSGTICFTPRQGSVSYATSVELSPVGFRIKIMSNPWLNIPLADYEGHMRSDEVQQLDALTELFAAALERCQPTSVAILGAGGGNGLDRIDSRVT